jgi:hypothetical protein
MFRHETTIKNPQPVEIKSSAATTLGTSKFKNEECPNFGKKDGCYLMSGAIIKCKKCKNVFNQKLEDSKDLEVKRRSERSEQDSENLKNFPEKPENEVFPESSKICDKPITKSLVNNYDPEDVYDKKEYSPKKVIRGVSQMNPKLDEKPPTRDEFELLKQAYQLLRQKYKSLKQKYDNFNQIQEVSKTSNQGIVTDAPMFTTTVHPLMKSFHESDKWPEQTNIFCWWCSHPFNCVPIALPISYNSSNKVFKVKGCFCSFECALAYKDDKRNLQHIDTSLLYFFFNKITKKNVNVTNLKRAPDRESLLIFGGHSNIEEFRKSSKDRNLQYDLVTYPLVPIAQYVEIKKKKDPETIKNNQQNQPRLKLKRSKPLMHHKNTLENSMGLNISVTKRTKRI